MNKILLIFCAIFLTTSHSYSQKLEDFGAGVIDFLLRNPKTANKMKMDEKLALDIIRDLLKTEGQRKHELEYAASGRNQILIQTSDGRQAQFVKNENGKVFLLIDGVIYPLAQELIAEATGRNELVPTNRYSTNIDFAAIEKWFNEPEEKSVGPLFTYKWVEDFNGDGALAFEEYRQVKKTFYDNENFNFAIPYRTYKDFYGKISWTIYNGYTGEIVKSGEWDAETNSWGKCLTWRNASNELPLGSYIINAKLIDKYSNVVASNSTEFEIIQGNSSTREISYVEKEYRQKISNSTPKGIFFCNSWKDLNNNGLYDLNEFNGLNKSSYSLSKDTLYVSINFPKESGEIIIQSWSKDGKLLGTTTKDYQRLLTNLIFPGINPYDSMDFIDMVKINGVGEYKITVSFVYGGTYEQKLVISP